MTVYESLDKAFKYYNGRLFDSSLPEVVFTLQHLKRIKGAYSPSRFLFYRLNAVNMNEIVINPDYFGIEDSRLVLQTLVHEMCHLYLDVNGYCNTKGYHDKKWASLMKSKGLQPSDTASEGGKETGKSMSQYEIEGGIFQKITDELLMSGWKIEWYDRYHIASLNCVSEVNTVNKAGSLQGKKFKYSCGCTNVWGKKNLNLVCARCGKQLKEC